MKKRFDPANLNAEGVVFKHKAKDKICYISLATGLAFHYVLWP